MPDQQHPSLGRYVTTKNLTIWGKRMSEPDILKDLISLRHDLNGCIQERADKVIEELQSKLAALRSQIVPWQKGGAMGGDHALIIQGNEYVIQGESHYGKLRIYQGTAAGKMFWTGGSTHYRWRDTWAFCPLDKFPMPGGEA